MNNSKKLRPKKVKEEKRSEKPITSISKPWIISATILVIVLIGALLFDQLYEPRLMTVDGKKYNKKDLSYYLYLVESSYAGYSQLFGQNVWDMPYDEEAGTTMRDVAREEAMDQSLYNEILYNEAIDNDYKLTEDEKKTISDSVNSLLKEKLPKEVIKKNGYTKDYLTKMQNKITLVSRFRQDKIDSFKIDEEKIKEGISFEDFKQYDIHTLFISTKTTDADGKTVDLSADEKKAAYDKISAVYEKAKTTKDWSTLVPTDEKELKYQDTSFIESDDTYSEDFEKMMMSMKNDEISQLYEDTNGYYIVRMVNNNSSERYDTEVKNAITKEENSQFDKLYEEIKKSHTYKLNNRAIKGLKMGTVTLAE